VSVGEGARKGVTDDVADVADVAVEGREGDELRLNKRCDWVLAVWDDPRECPWAFNWLGMM
jgi:hypothetical protein